MRGSIDTCIHDGCVNGHFGLGYCRLHYQRFKDGTRMDGPIRTGRRFTKEGYVLVKAPKGHPSYDGPKNGWVLEHRFVMEQKIGRYLYLDENVHHINGVRDDNSLENLELWSTSQPAGQRVEDKLAWAWEMITRYETLVTV